jgi:hypothetical protein
LNILTPEGERVGVRERSLQMGASLPISQGHATLSLTATANGTMRYASYIEIYRTNPWVWSSVQAIGRGLSR